MTCFGRTRALGRVLGFGFGLGALACAARPVGEDPASGSESADTTTSSAPTTETGSGGSEDSDPGTGETTTTASEGETDTGSDECEEPVKLDLPPDGEPEPPETCTIEPIDWPSPDLWPGCEVCEFEGDCVNRAYLACRTPPEGLSCADVCVAGDCFGSYWTMCEHDGPAGWNDIPSDVCGVYEIDGRCCSIGKFLAYCAE